jgi:hypothetical protein
VLSFDQAEQYFTNCEPIYPPRHIPGYLIEIQYSSKRYSLCIGRIFLEYPVSYITSFKVFGSYQDICKISKKFLIILHRRGRRGGRLRLP